MTPLPPLSPIAHHLDALRSAGLEIVPGSLRWEAHPERPGQWVAAVEVRQAPPVALADRPKGEVK